MPSISSSTPYSFVLLKDWLSPHLGVLSTPASWTSALISRLKISRIISWSSIPFLLKSLKTPAGPASVPGEPPPGSYQKYGSPPPGRSIEKLYDQLNSYVSS